MKLKGRKLLLGTIFVFISLLVGCRPEAEGILLRYTPQVGSTYRYMLELGGYLEVPGEMRVLSKDESGYRIQFSGTLDNELFSGVMIVTDRHNSNNPGYITCLSTINFLKSRIRVHFCHHGRS